MALKTDKLIHSRIDKLHQKVCLDSTKPLTVEDCMEFVKLRPAILQTTFERDAEFSIFSLLVDRSVGKPVMFTPRTFLDYDLTNLSPSQRQEKMNALGKTLTQVESYYKDFSFFTGYLDNLLPVKTQEDIYFGIEALWCMVALTYNLHVSDDHGGPAQDGTLFHGRRYYGDDKGLQDANY